MTSVGSEYAQDFSPPFDAFLEDLSGVGVQPATSGGTEYAVIKARTNARWWLLPLADRQAAAAGLGMLHPVTWRASLAKASARLAARSGLHWALGRARLRLAGTPDLCGAFREDAEAFAYFTGTDGPNRKTAIQIMGSRGRILGYAKASREPRIQHFISSEADMLGRLAILGLQTAQVPRVVVIDRDEARTLLVTDTLKTASYSAPRHLGTAHHAFLDEMAARTSRTGAKETLYRLACDVETLRGKVSSAWMARFEICLTVLREKEAELPIGLAHGDFTPWNAFVQSGRLYVFDWEYADRAYPIGYDHIHFLLAVGGDVPSRELADRIIAELSEARFHGDKDLARHAALFALLQHAAFYLRRSVEAGEVVPGFDTESQRGGLIDALSQMVAKP